MSELTEILVKEIKGKEFVIEIAQIHPDATMEFDLEGDDLKLTSFMLFVSALGHTTKSDLSLIDDVVETVLNMEIPDVEAVNKVLDKVEIIHKYESESWEEGYFDDMTDEEIRKPENWAKIPKVTVKMTFKSEEYINDIKVGCQGDTTYDMFVLEWL